MKRTLVHRILAPALATAWTFASWSQPESATPITTNKPVPAQPDRLAEVVVTATRTTTEAEKTAASISVIGREEIETRQIRTVAEALRSVPGVTVAANGPGQTTGLFVRSAFTRHTQIMVDGRPLPYEATGGYNLELLSTANVERIEVVRGPLSSLYGGPSIGGVVNIISRKGRGLERPEHEVWFEAGSYGTFREAVSSRGAFGPFDYSAEITRTDSENQRPNSEVRFSSINTTTGIQATRDLYVDLGFQYYLNDAGSPGSTQFPDPDENLLREVWSILPGVEWQVNEVWRQKWLFGHSQQRQVTVNTSFRDARTQINTTTADWQNDVQVAEAWLLTGGVAASDTRYYLFNDGTAPGSTRGTEDQNNRSNVGVYLQSQLEPVRNWHLISSVRIEHQSDFGNPVTYRVGSSYKIEESGTTVRASYGTAFSPPNLLHTTTIPFFGGNPNLKPERSESYEFGVDQVFLDGALTLFATAFRNNIDNLIVFQGGLNRNIQEARIEGVESGWQWTPHPTVALTGSYTFQADENVQTGRRLIRIPRHTFNSGVTWKPVQAVQLGLAALYVLDREDGFPQSDVEDYLVLRTTASWRINPYVEVFGRVENLLNEQYEEVAGYPALDCGAYGGFKLSF